MYFYLDVSRCAGCHRRPEFTTNTGDERLTVVRIQTPMGQRVILQRDRGRRLFGGGTEIKHTGIVVE